MSKPEEIIIAHRGESDDAPENTLAAINLAWERGVRAVEIDIQLTGDNKIVAIHDTNTFRVSGIKKSIKKSTIKELLQLDVGSYKGNQFNSEHIPLLEEVLKTIPENGKLIIEIKSNDKILKGLKDILDQTNLNPQQVEIIAFNIETLAKTKEVMPEYRMLWLLDLDYFYPYWLLRINKQKILRKLRKHNLDGVDVWSGKLLTKQFIDFFKKEGYFVYAWTINDLETASKLLDEGIDGITTNRAANLIEQLNKNNLNL